MLPTIFDHFRAIADAIVAPGSTRRMDNIGQVRLFETYEDYKERHAGSSLSHKFKYGPNPLSEKEHSDAQVDRFGVGGLTMLIADGLRALRR